MKTLHQYLLLCLIIALCSAGCKRKPKLTAEYIDSLKNTYDFLSSQVDNSWKAMIEEDDQKISSMKNLVNTIAGTGKYDTMTSRRQRAWCWRSMAAPLPARVLRP